MLKPILSYFFTILLFGVQADDMLGPGIWSLISVIECTEPLVQEDIQIQLTKHKLNRTHDGVSAKLKAIAKIDDNYGVLIDVCKYVDGGCKQYQLISDNSVVSMLEKYAKDMVADVLGFANIDPPEFPIPQGEYEINDYVVNYCQLPREAPYGKFEASGFLVQGNVKVGCVRLVLEFNKFEDGNFCDEDEDDE
ncbi:unnamed protein product, partial [Brenthis ino]